MRKFNVFIFLLLGFIIGIVTTAKFNYQKNLYAKDTSENSSSLSAAQLSNSYIALNERLKEIAKKTIPTIVSISTERTIEVTTIDPFDFFDPFEDFFGIPRPKEYKRKFKQKGLGSGIIISKDGYILTNNHVIGDAEKITVTVYLNDDETKEFDAKVIGQDPGSDVALIKIKPKGIDLPVAKLGDSDKLEVGELVAAIGAPLGLPRTFTLGVVSALHRQVSLNLYENYIQTDAAINPGNSGGALININGEVIGVNTAIASKSGGYQGIGFAIPINMAMKIVEQLKKNGVVKRGWLGISMQPIDEKVRKAFDLDKDQKGVLVADVFENSPAEKAGFKRGDIIIEVDGKKIENMNELRNLVGNTPPGTEMTFKVIRNKKVITLKAVLDERKDEKVAIKRGEPFENDKLGVEVRESDSGVIITKVKPNSIAARNGLKVNDIILKIGNEEIKTKDDFNKALKKIDKGDVVPFLIKRDKYTMFIFIQFNEE